MKLDRAERRRVMALAQARQIDAVLVTELSRWGRSTTDLLATLQELEARRVSVIALNGMAFDLTTPHGRMIATVLAGIAAFERELTQERIRSGIAAAKARGKRLGRQLGHRPKSDRLAARVMALVATGRSYRLVAREVGLSKNTVADIVDATAPTRLRPREHDYEAGYRNVGSGPARPPAPVPRPNPGVRTAGRSRNRVRRCRPRSEPAQQVGASARPAHLLRFVHPPIDQEVRRSLRHRRANPQPCTISFSVMTSRALWPRR